MYQANLVTLLKDIFPPHIQSPRDSQWLSASSHAISHVEGFSGDDLGNRLGDLWAKEWKNNAHRNPEIKHNEVCRKTKFVETFSFLPFLPESWKWEMVPSNSSFLSFGVVFPCHDCGRKWNLVAFDLEMTWSLFFMFFHDTKPTKTSNRCIRCPTVGRS